jgi:hypothetical protein
MNETKKGQLIRCTPENAGQMRELVKAWPQLDDLVRHLMAAGHIQGLRSLSITLTGSAEQRAAGLDGAIQAARSQTNTQAAKG